MKTYNLYEITDSRILYDKTPPPFMRIIIILATALIAAFLVWASCSIKTYVVRGQGLITAENKANVITYISGIITQVNVEEGKDVKQGDTLFTLIPPESLLQSGQANQKQDALKVYRITAPINGKVHLAAPITCGTVLQAGNILGTVSNSKEGLIINTQLSPTDRPLIHVGDEVSLAVGGLNQSVYGSLKGKVISIDEDATIDDQKGVYFKVGIKPERNSLSNKKGEKISLVSGMVAETRIMYQKITYMDYFLEQIGISLN